MAIRITGMYSGLDTESIINELASAQSYKKDKLVKAQTKLSWQQDAWKALNTKIYNFYQKLDELRLQSSYMKKKTVVSNPNAIQVTGGTVDGSHTVSVSQLSKRAALTSGNLSNNGVNYTGNATLKQLGFSGSGSIRISDNHGGYVDIDVDENMKINDFVQAIGENTALTASYDQDNQRIYINSWASGETGEFYMSGNDAGGLDALKALKLLSADDIDSLTQEGGEYDVWSKYRADSSASGVPGAPTADYLKLIEDETLARLKAMKEQNDALTQANKDYDEANQKNLDMLKEIQANADGRYDDYADYISSYNSAWTLDNAAAIRQAGEALYAKIYGTQAKNDDGSDKVDENGDPVMDLDGSMTGKLQELKDALAAKQDELKQAREDLAADSSNTALQQKVTDLEADVTTASQAVSDQQSKIDKAAEIYSFYNAFNYNDDRKQENLNTIKDNNKLFAYDEDTDTYSELDEDGNEVAIGSGQVAAEVTEQFDKKVAAAKDVMTNAAALKEEAKAWGTKVQGQDAKIVVDGVTYTSSTDSLTVNGMTIRAVETTDKDVTITTQTDTEGVYNMIKDFITAYSELINEMDSLYNADAATGYEPLLSEEKSALSDSEVEEWEKKIKDSLLRRDATLGDVASALKMDMMKGFTFGGQTLYLSDFGIATLGYFNSAENERNAYHIDGNPDDAKTKNNTDLLSSLINNNPEAVMEFFTNLTNTLHDTLADKMSATTLSSALTVYNDKKMKEEYDEYTTKIKEQEEKLNAYIDKWYTKFSAMETALAQLESKNNALASLLGG